MAQHNELGKAGEKAAHDFLISRGWVIREQNWRMGNLEIDLVVEDPATRLLHVVEVKTRSSIEHFDIQSAIPVKKRRNLFNAANGYVRYYQLKMGVVFDVVVVERVGDELKVHYIPNAFYPPVRTY